MVYEINLGNGQWATGPGGMALTVTNTDTGVKDALLMGCERNSVKTEVNKDNLVSDVLAYQPSVTYINGVGVSNNEPQAIELLSKTNDLTDAAWTKSGSTPSLNEGISPSGDNDSQKLTEDTNNGTHQVNQVFSKSETTLFYYTDLYVKQNGRSKISLWLRGLSIANRVEVVVDVNTCSVESLTNVGAFSEGVADVTSLNNGWCRVSVGGLSDSSSSIGTRVYLHDGNSTSYQGDGVSGVFLWEINLKQESKLSSTIKNTTTGTITRLEDTGFKTPDISKWIDSDNIKITFKASFLNNDVADSLVGVTDNQNINHVLIGNETISQGEQRIKALVKVDGTTILASSEKIGSLDLSDINEYTFEVTNSVDYSFKINNVLLSSGTLSSALNSLGYINLFLPPNSFNFKGNIEYIKIES